MRAALILSALVTPRANAVEIVPVPEGDQVHRSAGLGLRLGL